MAKPIFILGVQRSGTTWVANILCLHSKIAGIQADRHEGIHESVFFSNVKDRFGDLNNDNDFIEFIETFSNSDYFILSQLDKNYFYENRPHSYDDFFKMMMDKYAEKQNAEFWLEKTPVHTIYYKELLKIFPDAKFIVIKRNLMDSIKSDVRMRSFYGNIQKIFSISRLMIIFFLTFRYFLYYSAVKHKNKEKKFLLINYEDLKNDRLEITKKICRYLSIDFEEQLLNDKYKQNTRFFSEKERKEILTKTEILLIKLFAFFLKLIPNKIFHCLIPIYKNEFRRRGIPEWFYSIKKDDCINQYNLKNHETNK